MPSIEQLDDTVLAKYPEAAVPGFKGPLTASKIPGGQSNPTFRIDANSSGIFGTELDAPEPNGLVADCHATFSQEVFDIAVT